MTQVHVYWGHWCTLMWWASEEGSGAVAARLLLNLINLKRFMQIIPINGLNLRNLIIILLLPFFLFWGTITVIISGQAKKKHKVVRIYVTEDLWPHDERQRRITEAAATAYKKG